MPIYTFENIKTGETEDHMISYDEMEKYLKKNKHMRRAYKPIPIVDPVGIGITRPPTDFLKGVIGKVKEVPGAKKSAIERRWHVPKEI